MGTAAGVPPSFRWSAGVTEPPFQFVLLDADYGELLRVEGLVATELSTDGALRQHLQVGCTYHWYVVGKQSEGMRASLLETFCVR